MQTAASRRSTFDEGPRDSFRPRRAGRPVGGEPLEPLFVATGLYVAAGFQRRNFLTVPEGAPGDGHHFDALSGGISARHAEQSFDSGHLGRVGYSTDNVNGQLTGCDDYGEPSPSPAMLREVVGRVERRLEAVGLSATAASKKAGLSEDAIRNMKRAAAEQAGRKGVSTRTIAALAPVLKTTIGWLLDGDGPEEAGQMIGSRQVPVVGYVGAGAAAHFYATGQGSLDYVSAPEGASESTVATEIRGDSLGAFFDRWLCFYDDVRSPVTEDLIGHLCVVGLLDGKILVKKLQKARSPNMFHLLSQTEDPMFDVEVEWAAKVREIRPR